MENRFLWEYAQMQPGCLSASLRVHASRYLPSGGNSVGRESLGIKHRQQALDHKFTRFGRSLSAW